jgi:hypothetical protein
MRVAVMASPPPTRILAFGQRYSALQKPFCWRFARQDLERRLRDPLLQQDPVPLATAA